MMNVPVTSDNTTEESRHIIFDGVYQLNSQNSDYRHMNTLKNIDEIHFDLSQVLIDMQF
jgi:hypothetical protein